MHLALSFSDTIAGSFCVTPLNSMIGPISPPLRAPLGELDSPPSHHQSPRHLNRPLRHLPFDFAKRRRLCLPQVSRRKQVATKLTFESEFRLSGNFHPACSRLINDIYRITYSRETNSRRVAGDRRAGNAGPPTTFPSQIPHSIH